MRESPYLRRRARSLLAVIFCLMAPILACGIPLPKPADICRNWATSSSYLLEGIGLSQSGYRVLFPYIYEPEQVFNQVPEDVTEVAIGGCGPRGSMVKVYRIGSLAPPLQEEALLGEVRVQVDYTWRLENVTFSGREMIVAARAVTDDQTSGFSNRVVFFRAGSHGVSITDPPRGKEFLKKSIPVEGTGTPGARIILFVNDEKRGETQVNEKRKWKVGSVLLNMGENRLRAEMEMAGEGERVGSKEITVKRVGAVGVHFVAVTQPGAPRSTSTGAELMALRAAK